MCVEFIVCVTLGIESYEYDGDLWDRNWVKAWACDYSIEIVDMWDLSVYWGIGVTCNW